MTRRLLAFLLLLAPALTFAQGAVAPRMFTPFKSGGGSIASGSAISGCTTANAMLYMDASQLLACGGTPAPSYDATNIRLQVGTGSGTQQGWYLGNKTNGQSGLWDTANAPSSSNYTLMSTGVSTFVNSVAAAGSIGLQTGATTRASVGGAAGSGINVTAGTATTDVQSLSTTQTWNAAGVTFTGHKYTVIDTASAAGSLIAGWYGGASGTDALMTLSKAGNISLGGISPSVPEITAPIGTLYLKDSSLLLTAGRQIRWGTAGTADVWIHGPAAATIQMGLSVNGAPVAQTFKAHDGVSGTDIAGANLTVAGGRGTGAGAGGNRIDQTSPSLGTGTTAQTLQDRTVLVAKAKALTAAAATNVVLINVASGAFGGGEMEYTVQASDGTDHQARSGRIQWAVVNKAGTETCTVSGASEAADSSTVAVSAGTLTYAITADTTAANGCYIAFNAVSSLVETTLNIAYRITANGGTSTFTAQ